jgi:hypothetical protein
MEQIFVVLKFHFGKRGSVNPIISKTMGRVAVINHAYQGAQPQDGTFWLCRLDRGHQGQGTNGCFVVTPVRQIPLEKIVKLIPGTYDTTISGSTVVCKPKLPNHYWIAPFSVKKWYIKKDKAAKLYQAVIVPVEGLENVEPAQVAIPEGAATSSESDPTLGV